MNNTQTLLELASRPGSVSCVEPFIKKVAKHFDITPDVYGNILISLTEAVNNAIRHGNHNDESKKVKIQWQKRKNFLTLKVADQGHGFDHTKLPDPTSPENLIKVGGRGVFLIKQLSDQVRFHRNGSQVEMRFNLF